MDILNQMIARAKANPQRIVLPEGDEPRTLEAANILLRDKMYMPFFMIKKRLFSLYSQFRAQRYYFFLTYANFLIKNFFFCTQYCTCGKFFVPLQSE